MEGTTNIDPYLTIMDNDERIQERLELLANDAFNNNESLIAIRHEENEHFLELTKLIKPLIKSHEAIFLDEDARSFPLG